MIIRKIWACSRRLVPIVQMDIPGFGAHAYLFIKLNNVYCFRWTLPVRLLWVRQCKRTPVILFTQIREIFKQYPKLIRYKQYLLHYAVCLLTSVSYETQNKPKGKGLIVKVLLINIPKITRVYIQLRYKDMCFDISIVFLSCANNLLEVVTSDNCITIALNILIIQFYLTLNTLVCDLASVQIRNPNQNPTVGHLRGVSSDEVFGI